jgi:Holliday junction resolvase RusA-like endonuclease
MCFNPNMAEKFEIEVGMLAPTINHCYGRGRWGDYLKSEGKAFKALVKATVGLRQLSTDKPLALTIELHSPNWRTKKGAIHLRAGDADGFCKISIDSLAEALGFNDALIFDLRVRKVEGPNERTVFKLCELIVSV